MGDLAVRQPHLGRESVAALARIVASETDGVPQDEIVPYLLVRLLRCGYVRRREIEAALFVATPAGIARWRQEQSALRRRQEDEERREIIRGRVQAMIERMIDDRPPPLPVPSVRELPLYHDRSLPRDRQAQLPSVPPRRLPGPAAPQRPSEYRALASPETALQAIRDGDRRRRQELEAFAGGELPSAAGDHLPVVHVGRLPPKRGPNAPAGDTEPAAMLPAPAARAAVHRIVSPARVPTEPQAEASAGPRVTPPALRLVAPPADGTAEPDAALPRRKAGGRAWKSGAAAVAITGGALLIAGVAYDYHGLPIWRTALPLAPSSGFGTIAAGAATTAAQQPWHADQRQAQEDYTLEQQRDVRAHAAARTPAPHALLDGSPLDAVPSDRAVQDEPAVYAALSGVPMPQKQGVTAHRHSGRSTTGADTLPARDHRRLAAAPIKPPPLTVPPPSLAAAAEAVAEPPAPPLAPAPVPAPPPVAMADTEAAPASPAVIASANPVPAETPAAAFHPAPAETPAAAFHPARAEPPASALHSAVAAARLPLPPPMAAPPHLVSRPQSASQPAVAAPRTAPLSPAPLPAKSAGSPTAPAEAAGIDLSSAQVQAASSRTGRPVQVASIPASQGQAPEKARVTTAALPLPPPAHATPNRQRTATSPATSSTASSTAARPAAIATADLPAPSSPIHDLTALPGGETLGRVMARLRAGTYSDDAAVNLLNTLSLRAARAGRAFSPVTALPGALSAQGRTRKPPAAATQSAAAETAAFEP